MKNEWLIVPKEGLNNNKDTDINSKLIDILDQIEEGRGWRFTDEQADTLAKLVDSLIEQVRANNKKRNKERKLNLPFFK